MSISTSTPCSLDATACVPEYDRRSKGGVNIIRHVVFRTAHLDDSDDDVLQAGPFRVVVEQQLAILLRTAKGRGSHSRIQSAQVVVQGVQILIA